MHYQHHPEAEHAQVRFKKFGVTLTISSENIADGIAMSIQRLFKRTLTQADWSRIVDTLDSIYLAYKR